MRFDAIKSFPLVEGNMSHVVITLFDSENYDLWGIMMQTYLEGLDL